MDDTPADRFWRTICAYESVWSALLALDATLLALLAFAILVGPPSPETRLIVAVNVVILGTTLVGTTAVLYRCRRRGR